MVKRILVYLLVGFLIFVPIKIIAAVVEIQSATVTGVGQWTSTITCRDGQLSVSVEDTGILISPFTAWSGTITLQRYFNGAWKDVQTWTGNIETRVEDYLPGMTYKIGCDTGDWTAGTSTVMLGK